MDIRTLSPAVLSVIMLLIFPPALSADPTVVVYGYEGSIEMPPGNFVTVTDSDSDLSPLIAVPPVQLMVDNRTGELSPGISFVSASQGSAQLSAGFSNSEQTGDVIIGNEWYYEFTAAEDGWFKLDYTSTRVQPAGVAVLNRVDATISDGPGHNFVVSSDEKTDPPPTTAGFGPSGITMTLPDFSATVKAEQTVTTHLAGSGVLETDWTAAAGSAGLQTTSSTQYQFVAQEDGTYTLDYSDTGSAPTAGTAGYRFEFDSGPAPAADLTFAPGSSGTVVRPFSAGDLVDAKLFLESALSDGAGSLDTDGTFVFSIVGTGNPVSMGGYTIQFTGQSDVLFDPGGSGDVMFPVLAGNTYEVRALFDGAGSGASQFSSVGSFNFEIVPIPEPATMSLLGLGGLAVLRRRR